MLFCTEPYSMPRTVTLVLPPADAANEQRTRHAIAAECNVNISKVTGYHIMKRSIDARSRYPKVQLQVQAFINEKVTEQPVFDPQLRDVSGSQRVIIVGAGPAGLFAALRLITLG